MLEGVRYRRSTPHSKCLSNRSTPSLNVRQGHMVVFAFFVRFLLLCIVDCVQAMGKYLSSAHECIMREWPGTCTIAPAPIEHDHLVEESGDERLLAFVVAEGV